MRRFLLVAGSCLALLFSILPAQAAGFVTDMAGRRVAVPDSVQRVVLGEGRLIHAFALLEGRHPLDRLAGWQGDFRMLDPQGYAAWRRVFPAIDRIPLIGTTQEDTISPEKVLTLRPDLAIFSLSGHGPGVGNPLVQRLMSAGVPVIFVDFRDKPLAHTLPSLRLMGRMLHREAAAESYIAFYQSLLQRVSRRIATVPQQARPSVFIDLRAGQMDTLTSAGQGSLGEMVEEAGGRNVAAAFMRTGMGPVSIEQILASRPARYLATGTAAPGAPAGVRFGAAVTPQEARASLLATADRPQLKGLVTRAGLPAMGAWHHFYNAPSHIILIEALAKWLHPALFADVDPAHDLQELHRRFLPVPADGTYWVQGS